MTTENQKNRTSLTWLIWLFPTLALISTGFLYYNYWSHRGPLVQIEFNDATGIEPEKTTVKFRGVVVGKVEKVDLLESEKAVVVFVRLSREAKDLAVGGTVFSIIQPQVDFQGVRGLETLFRGSYIRAIQGRGEPTTKFIGRLEAEASDTSSHTVTYYLRSPSVDSINTGDPVYYRGFKIGSVTDVSLAPSGQYIETRIQIEKKYVKTIRTNTLFWQRSAVDAKIGLFDSKIKIGSLESMMNGGISIATPTEAGRIADAESRFQLQAHSPKNFEKWNPAF